MLLTKVVLLDFLVKVKVKLPSSPVVKVKTMVFLLTTQKIMVECHRFICT